MDEVGIETTIILTGATGAKFDRLVELYLKPYPTRFQLFCGLDTTHFDQADYPERAVAELVRCYRQARARRRADRQRLRLERRHQHGTHTAAAPGRSRLDAFWSKRAELNMPVNVHIADHPSCWKPT